MARLTAFVSSHSSLKRWHGIDYQQVACGLATTVGISATCMDAFPPSTDLERRCRDAVRDCDILILIVGWRYGQLQDGARSLTEIEWSTAEDSDKEIVALLHDTVPPDDIDPEELARATAFRNRFDRPGSRPLYGSFQDRDSFERALRLALSTIINEQSVRALGRAAHSVSDVLSKALESWNVQDQRRVPLGGRLTSRAQNPAVESVPLFMRDIAGVPTGEDEPVVTPLTVADACFPDQQRLIVYGEFGCGKSNFLEGLRLKVARRLLENTKTSRAPLLLHLGAWNPEAITFRTFVDINARNVYGDRIAGNDLCLLLDEVDNREQALDARAVDEIIDWLVARPRCWTAVAVRQIDGLGRRLLDATPHLEFACLSLDSIDSSQRTQFIVRNAAPGTALETLLRFVSEAEVSRDDYLLGMLGSPFNLKLLSAFTFGTSPIPTSPARLLRARAAAAYGKEAPTAPAGADRSRFTDYVGHLAIETLGGRRRAQTRVDEATFFDRVAAAADVFVRGGRGERRIWTGRYLSYFAAEALARDPGLLADIHPAAQYGDRGRIANRLDAALRDLIELDSSRFDELVACDPCLAAACLQHIAPEQRAEASRRTFSLLLLLLSSNDEAARVSAIEAIVALGEHAVPLLQEAMTCQEYWLRRRLVGVLNRLGGSESTRTIVRALGDDHKRVVETAERAILAFDTERRAQVEAFVDEFIGTVVSDDDHDLLRQVASLDASFLARVNGILGEEPSEAEPALVLPVVIAIEPRDLEEDDWAGRELLDQLRAAPSDAATAARCRRWLHHSTFHDRAWAHIWTRLWDAAPDADLRELAHEWLRVVPDAAGSWSHVWVRVIEGDRHNAALAARARQWLQCTDPMMFGWASVWRKLFALTPNDEHCALGLEWLQSASTAATGWAMVWKPLLDSARTGEDVLRMRALALSRLKVTPIGDWSWGYAFPELCKPTPTAEILDLGRAWVESALPGDGGWGYVFPQVWKAAPRDQRLEMIARDWLAQPNKSRASWSSVWEALLATYRRDGELFAAGIEHLEQVPLQYHGWGRVWRRLWEAHYRRDHLAELAQTWLRGPNLNHRGWPWVYSALFADVAPEPEMVSRGLDYLAESSRDGWSAVWRVLWDACAGGPDQEVKLQDSAVSSALALLAREWLDGPGVDDSGFSHVWEGLWRRAPDDWLRAKAITRVRDWPTDNTIRYIWQPLTAALSSDPDLLQVGTHLLRNGLPFTHLQWGGIWLDLWGTGSESPDLVALGQDWLISYAGLNRDWPQVWHCLWEERGADPALTAVAIAGLKHHAPGGGRQSTRDSRDSRAWRIVWPPLWNAGTRHPALITSAVARLRQESLPLLDFWGTMARSLAAEEVPPRRFALSARNHAAFRCGGQLGVRACGTT